MRAIRGVDDAHLLTLVCRDLADAGRFARLDNWQFRIVRQGIPGPYTFLLAGDARSAAAPAASQAAARSAFACPTTPVVRALLAELREPILSTTLILPGDERAAATIRRRSATRLQNAGRSRRSTPGRAPTCRRRWSIWRREPATIVRLGGGDPARLGLGRPSAGTIASGLSPT